MRCGAYVITAVPDPEATLDDFIRVLKTRRRTHSGQSYRRRERPAPAEPPRRGANDGFEDAARPALGAI